MAPQRRRPDPDRDRVLLRECLGGQSDVTDTVRILVEIGRICVDGWGSGVERSIAGEHDDVDATRGAIEVQADARTLLDIAQFGGGRLTVDQRRVAVPEKPDG